MDALGGFGCHRLGCGVARGIRKLAGGHAGARAAVAGATTVVAAGSSTAVAGASAALTRAAGAASAAVVTAGTTAAVTASAALVAGVVAVRQVAGIGVYSLLAVATLFIR